MKFLQILTAIIIFCTTTASAQIPTSGLIAYYPFNGSANDESVNGYNGTVYGNAQLVADRFGNLNSAYNFDGVDDWIGTNYAQTNLSAFSVSFWVKSDLNDVASKSYSVIENRGPLNGGGQSISMMYCCRGGWTFGFNGDLILIGQKKPMANDNSWTHIVGVWDSKGQTQASTAQFKIYVNGFLASTVAEDAGGSVTLPSIPNGFLKIARNEAFDSYFKGNIDDLGMWNRALTEQEVQQLYGDYYPLQFSCINWDATPGLSNFTDASLSPTAFNYLCTKGVIRKSQLKSEIKREITREEVAKIAFRALYGDSNHLTRADSFPVPFIDLQRGVTNYIREAKALSYLEYGDGIPVFKRSNTHFRPKHIIRRRDMIKALLETFNIKPDWTGYDTSSSALMPPFEDVYVRDDGYGYIQKAKQLSIISSNVVSFRPSDTTTREEAFLYLYRIMKLVEDNNITKPNANDSIAFFHPANITPFNFGRSLGLSDGNFNSYTKTSFGIAGLMPLTFGHSYNSIYTELPDQYFQVEPFSKGWSHNYNSYLQKADDSVGVAPVNARAIIVWGDGTMNSFKKEGNAYAPETKGVYSTLERNDVGLLSKYTYTTKNKMVYEFYRIIVGGTHPIWPLMIMRDRNNNVTRLSWSKINNTIRLDSVFEPSGRYLLFNYNPSAPDKIASVTARTGNISRTVSFDYNTYGDLSKYTDVRSNATEYFYENASDSSKNHLLKQIKLPKGNVVNNTYENRKLKSSELVDQFKTTVNFTTAYTGNINVGVTKADIITIRNGVNLPSSIAQDTLGNVRHAKSPTSDLKLDYDDPSNATKPSHIINSLNNLSAAPSYDANGNILSVSKKGKGITITESFTYNSFNDVLTYTNGKGNTTTFSYDAKGNLTQIKDALNYTTNIDVNPNGTVARVTNPESIYTDFTYNIFGNTTSTTLQGFITSSAEYDDASRLIKSIDPNGVITQTEYEPNDLVKKVVADVGGLNNTVSYSYDNNDNLTGITNPKGGITNLKYNDYDQMVEYSFAGFKKTYAYNDDGTLKTFTSQRKDIFNYLYNDDGTLKDDGYATYTYDGGKNLKTITKGNQVITFDYDDFKRTNKVTYAQSTYSDNIHYEYDKNNNVTAIIYPNDFKVGYEYDALDRLVRVYNVNSTANYATYSYLKDGRLSGQTNGNGTKTSYFYDATGRLDSIANLKSDNTIISAYGFSMDKVGNHTRETAIEPHAPAMPALAGSTIAYTHDAANRMNTRGNTTLNYDDNGNNTNADGQWKSSYNYDSRDNLLTSAAPALNCEYDGLENRRIKNNTRYVLDILGGSNVLMETDLNGNPTAYYIHGLGLISRLDASQGNEAYYHYDYRGSTTAITNASQNITHRYLYGPFGEMLAANENGFINTYRYVGKYGVQFEDSSIYFMRARYYNPMKGRFLGEDPISSFNLYTYGLNNPISNIDPSGKIPVKSLFSAVGFAFDLGAQLLSNVYYKQKWSTGLVDIALDRANDFFGDVVGIATSCDLCGAVATAFSKTFTTMSQKAIANADVSFSYLPGKDQTTSSYLLLVDAHLQGEFNNANNLIALGSNLITEMLSYGATNSNSKFIKNTVKFIFGGVKLSSYTGKLLLSAFKDGFGRVGGDINKWFQDTYLK